MDKATAADLEEKFKITIDGHEIEVHKAISATDEQGNIRRDEDDRIIPRPTTIYDASSIRNLQRAKPMPTFCHREYLA